MRDSFTRQARSGVFISYSRHDREWMERVSNALKPLENRFEPVWAVWDDRRVSPSETWRNVIEAELAKAKIVVFLVSPDFVRSEFIRENELAVALDAASRDDLLICPLEIRAVAHEDTGLSEFQWLYGPSGGDVRPLGMLPAAEQDQVFRDTYRKIRDLLLETSTAAVDGSEATASPVLSEHLENITARFRVVDREQGDASTLQRWLQPDQKAVLRLVEGTDRLIAEVERAFAETGDHAEWLQDLVRSEDDVATIGIVGPQQSGKSTLISALVGEAVVPTDQSLSPKLPTRYESGLGYGAYVQRRDGVFDQIPFRRKDGVIDVDFPIEEQQEYVASKFVWPSHYLSTCGLAFVDNAASGFTGDGVVSNADPFHIDGYVVVLPRAESHLIHREALDRLSDWPAACVAILGRSDELGGYDLDAVDTAWAQAELYGQDVLPERFLGEVMPVSGLLAMAGSTLRLSEWEVLDTLGEYLRQHPEKAPRSSLEFEVRADMPFDEPTRRTVLRKFGMYGMRLAIRSPDLGVATAQDFAELLTSVSGIRSLRSRVASVFGRQGPTLIAANRLSRLRGELVHCELPQRAALMKRTDDFLQLAKEI